MPRLLYTNSITMIGSSTFSGLYNLNQLFVFSTD